MNKIIYPATIRERLRLTQTQIAAILGMAQGNYSAMEAGRKGMSKKILERYIAHLKVSESYLLRGIEPIFSVDTPLYSDRIQQTLEALEINKNNLSKALPSELYRQYIQVASNEAIPDADFFFKLFDKWKEKVNFDYLIDGRGEPIKKQTPLDSQYTKPGFYETYKDVDELQMWKEAIVAYRIALSEKEKIIVMKDVEIQKLNEQLKQQQHGKD